MQSNSFLKSLIESNLADENNIQDLLSIHGEDYFSILLALKKEYPNDKNLIGRHWGDYIKKSYTDLVKVVFDQSAIMKLSKEDAIQYNVIPLYQFGNVLSVASSKPQNPHLIDKLQNLTGQKVSLVFSYPDDINSYIDIHYSKVDSLNDIFKKDNQIENENRISIKESYNLNDSLISAETKEYMLNNVKEIEKAVENNSIPPESTCRNLSNKITEELHSKFDVMSCINQLRISDDYTYSHSINVAMLSAAMGKLLGYSQVKIKELTFAALLHDIGKMRIPKVIRNKPTELTKDELDLVKRHPQLGYDLLKQMKLPDNITEVALNHHERLDGLGYPKGIGQDKISVNTQIVSIVDVYDALISDRSYKKAMSSDKALNVLLLEGMGPLNYDLLYKFASLVYRADYNEIKKQFKETLYH